MRTQLPFAFSVYDKLGVEYLQVPEENFSLCDCESFESLVISPSNGRA